MIQDKPQPGSTRIILDYFSCVLAWINLDQPGSINQDDPKPQPGSIQPGSTWKGCNQDQPGSC